MLSQDIEARNNGGKALVMRIWIIAALFVTGIVGIVAGTAAGSSPDSYVSASDVVSVPLVDIGWD